jgi:predicted transcriptional regulator
VSETRPTSEDESFFDEIDEAAEIAADETALAEAEVKGSVPHEGVRQWLETWGTPNEQPPPAEWFR